MQRDDTMGRQGRFGELVAASKIPLGSLTLADGIALITRFFEEEFADGVILRAWWGIVEDSAETTYGLGMSMDFGLDPDGSISFLKLRFKIGPRSVFGDFPSEKIHWCMSPADLPGFRSGIENSAPFRVWGRSPAVEVAPIWEDWNVQPPEPPVQPGDRMTAEQWRRSEDPVAMLRALRATWRGDEAERERLIHRYLLACCRAIWRLLPMEESRVGVEVAERYIEGRATREEFGLAEYQAEGAAFFLDPFEYEPEDETPEAREDRLRYKADRQARIAPLVGEVEAMPPEELRRLVRLEALDGAISPRQVLADAAYFADSVMDYPSLRPKGWVIEKHRIFLSAALLREIVGDSFHPESS